MPQYILSAQARQSLIQISDYTLKNYGEVQRKKYLKQLRDKMRLASKSPHSGLKRDDIKEGYHSIHAGKHYIYYRICDTDIEIIDVLHQSMEPKLHL